MKDSSYSDLQLFRRLMAIARPYWPHIGVLLVLSLLSTPVALLSPVPLKIAVDSVLGSEPVPGFIRAVLPAAALESTTGLLVAAVALLILIALVRELRSLVHWWFSTYTGEKLVLRFREKLFQHVHRLPFTYHDREGTSSSLYRIQYDAPAIKWVAIEGVLPLVGSLFTVAGMVYVMVRIDWVLTLVALSVVPVLIGVTQVYRPRLRRQWTETKDRQSSAMSVVQEALSMIRVVKAFGQEQREQRRFSNVSRESIQAHLRAVLSEGTFSFVIGMVTAIGTAGVLLLGINHVRTGVVTLGNLLVVMSYLSQLYDPLRTIGQRVAELQSSLASAERTFTLLDRMPEVTERPDARPLERAEGRIEFESVSFGYEDEEKVLRDVSFEVAPGARVGIAGKTGAGKSTLVSLLPRFWDPDSGRISLDGTDLRDYRLDDLRHQYSIVLQEPVLFRASIAENIGYGRSGAVEAEIVEAARAANIHEFIANLPEGYETVVGERGMQLSGGERQRVSLARAFLKDAPLLILDEPTSSVDMHTEQDILEAMDRLMAGRTVFMIAHRLETLRGCDVLFVLEEGELVARTHNVEELLDSDRLVKMYERPAGTVGTGGSQT